MSDSYKDWTTMVDVLWDDGHEQWHKIPGPCLIEWYNLMVCGYNEIDRLYVEHETIGGA